MFLLNTKAPIYATQAVVPLMKAAGTGRIIMVASFLARLPMASALSVYSACKAALVSLGTNLRVDLAPDGIHVINYIPGLVGTGFGLAMTHGGDYDNRKDPHAQDVNEVGQQLLDLSVNAAPPPELYSRPAYRDMFLNYHADIVAAESKPPFA